jgi:hypothetical protein
MVVGVSCKLWQPLESQLSAHLQTRVRACLYILWSKGLLASMFRKNMSVSVLTHTYIQLGTDANQIKEITFFNCNPAQS